MNKRFKMIMAGIIKLNKVIIPNFSGIRLGIKKEAIKIVAKTLFRRKINLLIDDNFFIVVTDLQFYFLPTENKKSFSSLVKVSYPDLLILSKISSIFL